MAVPKRKKSKSRVRMRIAHKKAEIPAVTPCPNCGADQRAHRVCPVCGQYRGHQILPAQD